jgi:N-acetylglutamate synthase-like GNAT family acetyltransferase
MADWLLRRATTDDGGSLSDCIEAAYSIYSTRVPDLPAVSEGVAGDIANHRVWVIEMDQKIVGGIIMIPRDGYMFLANVAVHPTNAGLGFGRILMDRAESDCLELGMHELRLNTHVEMPENVDLYSHLGWRETGRAGNKVMMKKTL